jgi:PKD repeat protein
MMKFEGKIRIKNKMKPSTMVLFLTFVLLLSHGSLISIGQAEDAVSSATFMHTPHLSRCSVCPGEIEVEKTVWNNSSGSWSQSTIVSEGEIVVFHVSIYNPYDDYLIHFGGKVLDILPCNLRYINGSSTIYEESGWPNLEEVYWDENKVVWPQAPTIYPHEYLNFTYQAQGILCGSAFLKNNLTVIPGFLEHVCDPSDVIYNDGSMNVYDTASVLVTTMGAPTADFTYEPRFPLVNQTVWFNSTSFDMDGSIESYFWEFGDGGNSTQENTTHYYENIGEYLVILTVTDNDGFSDHTSKTILITTGEPVISYVYPEDNTTNVILLPPLIIEVYDADSSEIQIQWWSNVTGTWMVFAENSSAPNKLFTQKNPAFTSYNTTYWWGVSITDGMFWTNETYQFTTREEIIDDEAPILFADYSDQMGTTGDPLRFSIIVTDNLDDAAVLYVSVLWGENQLWNDTMQWNTSMNRWELTVDIPHNDTLCYYWFYMRDTSGNVGFLQGNYSPIPISDNDPPIIENILSTPNVQKPMQWVNISASVFDNMGVTRCSVQIWGPNGFTGLNESMIPLDENTWFYNQSYTAMGMYYFTIWAEDTSGNTYTSEQHGFNITNYPEKPRRPSGLTTVKRRTTAGYTTEGFDVDGDPIQFRFDWHAAGSHAYSAWSEFLETEELTLSNGNVSITMYHSWSQAGSYSVRAQSRDIYGAMSPWSDPITVRVIGTSTSRYTGEPPVADMSAGEPYEGFVNDDIVFDGSASSDEDGVIVSYVWEFGDGNTGTGETVTHRYTQSGSFTVTLTVTDDDNKKDSCTGTAVITQLNRPPETPSIEGETDGSVNITYTYTLFCYDADEDPIRFFINWDDGTLDTTEYVASNLSFYVSHAWKIPDAYFITVYAEDDENARSGTQMELVLIDVGIHFIDDVIKGYLLDKPQNGIFDLFHNNASDLRTPVERLENGSYLIDADGDGIWDYVFNPDTDRLTPYKEAPEDTEDEMDYTALCITFLILLLLIIVIVYLYLRRKYQQEKEKHERELERFQLDTEEEAAPKEKKPVAAAAETPDEDKTVKKKQTGTKTKKAKKTPAKKKTSKTTTKQTKGSTKKKPGKKPGSGKTTK